RAGYAPAAAALAGGAALRLGVDATQLGVEAQRLQVSLRKPPAPVGVATTTAAPPAWERDLITLLLGSAAARHALLPLLDVEDLAHAALREVAVALRERPDAEGAALLADLPSDAARSTLSALLVADAAPADPEASIEQFRRRLDRAQRLRRLRAASRDLAERQQATTSVDDPLVDALRDLERESKTVYGYTRAVGLPHPMGPEGPQGVQAHD